MGDFQGLLLLLYSPGNPGGKSRAPQPWERLCSHNRTCGKQPSGPKCHCRENKGVVVTRAVNVTCLGSCIMILTVAYVFSFHAPSIPRDISKMGINCPMLSMRNLRPRKIRYIMTYSSHKTWKWVDGLSFKTQKSTLWLLHTKLPRIVTFLTDCYKMEQAVNPLCPPSSHSDGPLLLCALGLG